LVKASPREAVVRPRATQDVRVEAIRLPAGAWQRVPALPLLFTAALAAFLLLPRVRENRNLTWTFVGVVSLLLAWELIVWRLAARRRQALRVELTPIRSHWVQALVQLSIIVYWALNIEEVLPELPLVLAQVLFLYCFDALMSWTRGRSFRFGFGALPIIFSTNLLLWFRDDWYYLQFAMVATGALGKEFIKWTRDGKRTHIFNPSVFGQTLVAIALLATGTTLQLTHGGEIAARFGTPPYMYLVIFLGGLVVQSLFHVTLMTLAAAATLCAVNLVYTGLTGSYWFVVTNIAAPIFLGLHLLITDPSTSPRSNTGRVVFGVLYGLGVAITFKLLDVSDAPQFWDKLLPVGLLNLSVPAIDRFARSGVVGRFNRWWETSFRPARANLVHMACWSGLFLAMIGTGFVQAPHPGNTMQFWQRAYEEGKPRAGAHLWRFATFSARKGSAAANVILGDLSLEGKVVPRNPPAAAAYFARACELGHADGCTRLARLVVEGGAAPTQAAVECAFTTLERTAATGDAECIYLLGLACATGRGRPQDSERARQLFEHACRRGHALACERLRP
jgi:Na+-translocating ferredoxin:NAD+ oxidoreductase RnfD subunit